MFAESTSAIGPAYGGLLQGTAPHPMPYMCMCCCMCAPLPLGVAAGRPCARVEVAT
jgi:hypothetical protein